jgi:hypothetical protein
MDRKGLGMSGFWRNALVLWCWAVALTGVMLAGAAFEATSEPVRYAYAMLGGPQSASLQFDPNLRFSIAVMGAVTFGWSLTVLAVVQYASAGGRALWIGVSLSVAAWFVLDSALSIATGFALNALANTLLLTTFLIAVIRSGALQDRRPRS